MKQETTDGFSADASALYDLRSIRFAFTADAAQRVIAELAGHEITEAVYGDKAGEAAYVKRELLVQMRTLLAGRLVIEVVEAEHMAFVRAECKRIDDERADLDRQSAAMARIATEQEVMDAKLAERLAECDERDAAALLAEQHAEALEDDKLFDAARLAGFLARAIEVSTRCDNDHASLKMAVERKMHVSFDDETDAYLTQLKEAHTALKREQVAAMIVIDDFDGLGEPSQSFMDETEPTDAELIEVLVDAFGMSSEEAVKRILRFADDVRAAPIVEVQ